jgi:sulfite dehydrogenase (quinone) subunit SoeC
MHPAYSVIIFTCASGAGYGLLCWIALNAILGGWAQRSAGIGLAALIAAFVLITVGLLSSTSHLGRPERAWRAFSQWRTSWLSREGIMAMVTYAFGGLFALEWIFGDPSSWALLALLALFTLESALVTLWCTGMIYASLKTIRAWNHKLVAPLYVVLGLMTGRLLLNLIVALGNGEVSSRAAWLTLILLLAGWILKANYWSAIDNARRTHTIGDATGLGRFGTVRTLDPPHTQANFVMREMGFEVARKHADRLRQLTTVTLFVIPAVLTLLLFLNAPVLTPIVAVVAALSATVGIAVERWLFFAEAEHVSMLYYGREAA